MTKISLAAVALVLVAAAAGAQSPPPSQELANPASVGCVAKGGKLTMERRPDGGQYGVCLFEDNRQCEEWALFRGQCPAGGRRITGYVTQAGRFCAITGGSYSVTANSGKDDEQGTCVLPGGKSCDAVAYYRGTCTL